MKKTNTVIHIEAGKFYYMILQGFVNFENFILEKGGANLTTEQAYRKYCEFNKERWYHILTGKKVKSFPEFKSEYKPSQNYKDYLNRYQHFYDIDQRFMRLERVTSSVIQNNAIIDVSISDYDFVLNWIDRSDVFHVQYNSWLY